MIEGQTIVHDVTYPHPPERVWRALVDVDEMALWLMPTDGFVPLVGQRFTLACGSHGTVHAEVVEVDPPKRLRCRWSGSFGDTVVTFDLSPVAEGTRLRLEHRGWRESNSTDRDAFDSGWAQMFTEDLTRLLAQSPNPEAMTTAAPPASG
jgi:uncharacterized protein YndB with AHSA1/START domain